MDSQTKDFREKLKTLDQNHRLERHQCMHFD